MTSNKCYRLVAVALLGLLPRFAWADLGPGWALVGGEWSRTREVIEMIRQGSEAGTRVAFCEQVRGRHGAWRSIVEPALGAKEAGIWFLGTKDLQDGFRVVLGGNPGIGGLALRSAAGATLWEDRYAPWSAYQPYVLEGVVEQGKVRVQMFEWDGRTLISQSPWIDVPEQATEREGALGLYTMDGIARFWNWERADRPLSPIVEDAPNKRRLVQEGSTWTVVGPGNWMWTTAAKQRLRQCAPVERSSALDRRMCGALRQWECRLKVDQGTGGAGMLFQANEQADQGFIAWLGGTPGGGSLMLYRLPVDCIWSGQQGNWRYDTEYVLRAETRPGAARAQLLESDGKTVIQETPWVGVPESDAARSGFMGFMTWRGTAEFWGFSEATQQAAGRAEPARPGPSQQLGAGWVALGDGQWEWADDAQTHLRQKGAPEQAVALNMNLAGIEGIWRCRVRVGEGTRAAGLVFQANKDLQEGFACLLTSEGCRLENLAHKVLWEDESAKWSRGGEYVLEGEVMVDRVAMRVLAADRTTVIAECPAVYVPERNNHRAGYLGVLTRGGPAEFWGWAKD